MKRGDARTGPRARDPYERWVDRGMAERVAVMYGGRVIETAPARELYANPRHPYTQGLLDSVPRLDDESDKRLIPIDGQPPDLAKLPQGCAFSARCRYVRDRCRAELPLLEPVATDHSMACFGYE